MTYDTPETVRLKIVTSAMFQHYLVNSHEGDFLDCSLCNLEEV